MEQTTRYTLARDDDAHWFVVKAEHVERFSDLCAAAGSRGLTDVESVEFDGIATPVCGSPSLVTFTDPVIR